MIKKFTFLLISLVYLNASFAQNNLRPNAVAEVISGGGTSAAGAAPLGTTRYQRVCYLVLGSEMTTAGIASNTILNSIGFQYSIAHDVTVNGSFKVYLQNTTDASFLKSTTWDGIGGTIDGMTLASNSSIILTAGATLIDHSFSGGSNFTYTGGNLYIAYEFQNPSGTLSTTSTALCNSITVGGGNGLRRSTSLTALPTAISSSSAFRPNTRLGYVSGIAIDASVVNVQTLGKIAPGISNPHVISAVIKNTGDNTLTNQQVTLTVSGANSFSNIQTIATLAPGYSQLVTFNGFNSTNLGTNNIVVSVPSDGNNSNNSASVTQTVSSNTISTAYNATATAGVGNTATIEFGTKFLNTGSKTVDQLTLYFPSTSTGQPYNVVIYDATGTGGNPGTALWTSAPQTTGGANVNLSVPNVVVNGTFYVTIQQTGTSNMGYGYETENPLRSGTFYLRTPIATGAWGDMAPSNSFRLMMDVRFSAGLPVQLSSFTGIKDGNKNVLKWNTITELNNKGFDLQRSLNGADFSTIASITSKAINGNSNATLDYEFNDDNPLSGNNYYRLQQTDKDGKTSLSQTILIKGNKINGISIAAVYPNPVKDRLNINISSATAEKVTMSIIDVSGKVLIQKVVQLTIGELSISEDISQLNKGNYLLKLTDASGKTNDLKKIVKQ